MKNKIKFIKFKDLPGWRARHINEAGGFYNIYRGTKIFGEFNFLDKELVIWSRDEKVNFSDWNRTMKVNSHCTTLHNAVRMAYLLNLKSQK